MRFTLIFLILGSIFICSCKPTTNEEAYKNALEKSNIFIIEANESLEAKVESRASYDPRPQTQEIRNKVNLIHNSTLSYVKKLEKNKAEINIEELCQFKRDLIRNNIDSPDWDYFFEDDFYNKSEIKMIPYLVAINDVTFLANQMLMFHERDLQWSDFKIDKQQAIFKVDSNTYLALFAFGSANEIKHEVTITSVIHNAQKLSPDQYTYQYRSGFYGVIMNFDDNSNNRLGEYQINYEIRHEKIGNNQGYKFNYINIFLIEE